MDNPDAALTALRDIHLPPLIGWWPIAPGWYGLVFVLLLLGVIAYKAIHRHYINIRPKRQALHLLELFYKQYQKNGNNPRAAARISELLRRVAIAYYPRENVASLKQDAWIAFLNKTSKEMDFYTVEYALLHLPYQSQDPRAITSTPLNNKIQTEQLHLLFIMARDWITKRRGRCLN